MFDSLRRYLHERKHGKNFYLVYSMGKVGSSTVYDQLKAQYPFLPAIQIHFLSDHWLKEVLPKMNSAFSINHKVAAEYNALRAKFPEHRLKIITLVREPVIRDISDVFENWKAFFGLSQSSQLTTGMVIERLSKHDFSYTLNWFDTEFRNWTKTNIYDQPFDTERGYSVWHFDAFDVLCMKLEKLNDILQPAMQEFGGCVLKPGEKSNVSSGKAIREVYQEVVNNFRLSKVQEEIVFSSKYLNHFYSAEEIAAMKSRWCRTVQV